MQQSIRKLVTAASVITLLNLSAGLAAIYLSIHGHFDTAVVAILAATFFDVLDGLVAKLLNQTSEFGAQLDSLADLVSFGVAPFVLLTAYYHKGWFVPIAALVPICGALRLARYNVLQKKRISYFLGMPIDTSGVLAILVFAKAPLIATVVATILLSYLFVTRFKIPRLF